MKAMLALPWVAPILLALPLRAQPPSASPKIQHMVVLPFQLAQGLDEKSGKILDEVFLSELTPLIPQGVQVVGSSDVTAVL
ncbi:MAG: hypothetical protein ABIJ09_05765, partial [Pseudomonadota bacterium]